MPKIDYTRFPVTSPKFAVDGKTALLRTNCRADFISTRPTSPQQVVVMEFGSWETRRHSRHNGLLAASTCYGLAAGRVTGVMEFGLYAAAAATTAWKRWCRRKTRSTRPVCLLVARRRQSASVSSLAPSVTRVVHTTFTKWTLANSLYEEA